MKICATVLSCLVGLALTGCATGSEREPVAKAHPQTFSSFDVASSRTAPKDLAAGSLNFQNADLAQVLAIYQELSGRTIIRPATLPAPTITVRNQVPMCRVQALQLLDTVLAQNGITMVLAGDTAVKAVPEARAAIESPPEITLAWEALPESGSFMMRTVQLKTLRPSEVVPVLQPLARAPNGILPIDARNELILRDYSSNIRQMLKVLQDLEKNSGR